LFYFWLTSSPWSFLQSTLLVLDFSFHPACADFHRLPGARLGAVRERAAP